MPSGRSPHLAFHIFATVQADCVVIEASGEQDPNFSLSVFIKSLFSSSASPKAFSVVVDFAPKP